MTEYWGPGVSRTLSALARSFSAVVWQRDKPPLDSELNLMSQIDWENLSQAVRSQVHSGFFTDPTRAREDFVTDPLWANQFEIGVPGTVDSVEEAEPVLIAAVNGWVFPVAGTRTLSGVRNRIALNPPPTTDSRTDFVFLEVWRTLVAPNPSLVNKPTASTLWKYGNVEFGGTNVTDDLEDPAIGFETTERVQLQYRIRVIGSGDSLGISVDLSNYPDGMDDPQVRAQGTATTPSAFTFLNMRQELGDPSLWRAGDGNPANGLGTIDGYVYAVPIAGIFRRNASPFVAVTTSGNPNQNGASERTPSSRTLPDPRDGARALLQATLTADISDTATGPIALTNLVGSALSDVDLFPPGVSLRFLVVGEGINREIIAFSGTDGVANITVPTPGPGTVSGRGRHGTMARSHLAGTSVSLYNSRPDGDYADEIVRNDIVDLRRSLNFGDWDYTRLLQHAVASLVQGNLRTSFKKSGTGGDSFGVVTTEVSYLWGVNTTPAPNHVDQIDGPDGIRTVWSDSAALQPGVTIMVDPNAPTTGGFADTTFDSSVAANWSVGADFQPNGFLNNPTGDGWTNGSVLLIHIGGTTGTDGARAGFPQSPNPEAVRFVSPQEMWLSDTENPGNQRPWKVRFEGGPTYAPTFPLPVPGTPLDNAFRAGRITTPAATGEDPDEHPGPMYPLRDSNFERPFIVLGGVLNSALVFSGVPSTSANFFNPVPPDARFQVRVPGLNFDTFSLPLLRGERTLRDMLTDGGRDHTGASSLVYVVVYGNSVSRDNNGAFRVVGAGTAAATGGAYTDQIADAADQMVVVPLSADFNAFTSNVGETVFIEFRSQVINAEDDHGRIPGPAGVALVFTDLANISGGSGNPWNSANTGTLAVQETGAPAKVVPVNSKAVISSTLLWHPNRGASTRVPDNILKFVARSSAATFLRNVPSVLDPEFATLAPYPEGEREYDPTHVQLWNRLSSKGEDAPLAPAYGGFVVGRSEQDREHELFVDLGSKTAFFRPFVKKTMTLKALTTTASPSLLGPTTYLDAATKDGAAIFTTGLLMGYPVPPEYMPRFGRQDVPYHVRTAPTDPFMPGINHLFCDETDDTAEVFWVIGGEDNGGSPASNLVNPILFATGAGIAYGHRGTVGGPPHPAYGGRKKFYSDVISSDLGAGLNGVELPPYLGIARLYGVYELQDFLAHLDPTYIGGFQGDRLTPTVNPPTNLLRTDADQQTLFIRKGGGNDVTGTTAAHTYLVPDSAIDVTRIPGYASGQTFTSFDYVVECVVFGFSEGWIDQNNIVLARRNTGTGADVVDGSNPELVDVSMVLPCAAPRGDVLYQAYERTVYQGDPYMTRDGSTIQISDYESRYGQINQSDAFQLATSIEQFDPTTGEMTVERPNPRALQVLASMDFYTTLGTGKIGGRMFSGTELDAGYIDPFTAGSSGRIPASPSALPWRVLPRAFTEGQGRNVSRAAVSVQMTNANLINGVTSTLQVEVTQTSTSISDSFLGGTDFVGANTLDLAATLAAAINASAELNRFVSAYALGDRVILTSKEVGEAGNSNRITLSYGTAPSPFVPLNQAAQLLDGQGLGPYPSSNLHPVGGVVTEGFFVGGTDLPVNAGAGNSAISLGGFTERLPLGILASDSDFFSENPLDDTASAMRTYPGGVRPIYSDLPLTTGGLEYTRFLNDPGSMLSMSDGGILLYTPYTTLTPAGSKKFRLFRGGGAAFVLSGNAPGGPVDWVGDSFPSSLRPVLKGGVLAGKALLVRNFHEEAFSGAAPNRVRSEGDEIQMVVMTYAVYGDGNSQSEGVEVSGQISPTGYGEGYAAADRYLLEGRPMDRGRNRTTPNPALQPAPFFRDS